jgi:hypothetical protein
VRALDLPDADHAELLRNSPTLGPRTAGEVRLLLRKIYGPVFRIQNHDNGSECQRVTISPVGSRPNLDSRRASSARPVCLRILTRGAIASGMPRWRASNSMSMA